MTQFNASFQYLLQLIIMTVKMSLQVQGDSQQQLSRNPCSFLPYPQGAERNNKPQVYDDLQEMPDRFLNNRHSPMFPADLPTEITVSEATRVGASILEMTASDMDQVRTQ